MAVAFLASSDDGLAGVCCFLSSALVIAWFFRKKTPTEPPPLSMPATPPPVWKVSGTTVGSSSGSLFDPFRDARVPGGIQGVKNYLLPGEGSNLIHSVTLNDDFIAITRDGDEHQAILLDSATVASLQLGAMSEYPPTRYHMILSRGKETAAFPISFHGWLNLFDACRKAGGTLEAAEEISDEMRIKVLGPAGAARTPAAAKATPTARPTKCPSCGAALGKRGPCDYCGSVA